MTPSRDWNDPDVARTWADRHLAGNPVREEHLGLLLDVLEHVVAPRTVLDLGCGSGVVAEMVLDRLPAARLLGIDGSAAMLAEAGARLERFGDRVRLVRSDFAALDGVTLDPVDAAFAVQAVHHVGEAQADVLRWLRRAVRPGGRLLLLERVDIPSEALYPIFRRTKERGGHQRNAATWAGYRRELADGGDFPVTAERLLAMLRAAGFDAACLDIRADRAFLLG
jgi:ubiquinone/menaquinone biosynthesis C-methylase UbiE